MAAPTDELILLERVFFRLGSAETDEQLQAAVSKFLPPVLLKLSSTQEGVRKKVMELLIHINKRIKSRPRVELPVETLLLQYQDPTASSFVINFTIIYIKLGYPRMETKKQAELVLSVLNAVEGKPLSHQDGLLLMIMPALGHINVSTDPEKRASFLGLRDKPYVSKQLLSFMLDVLLLPYGSAGQVQQNNEQSDQSAAVDTAQFRVPMGMSEYAFKRVIGESPQTAEQLEQTKLGIVKFLAGGFFPDSDILVHLIVAAADTRFSVANLADMELKKIVDTLDWSSMQLAAPLYTLYLGTEALGVQKEVKPEMKRLPACIRIRLKLLHYLCRVTKAGFIIPLCIQVVFHTLEGDAKTTNPKLKSLALQFTSNIVTQSSAAPLSRVAGIILDGMLKLVYKGEDAYKMMAYTVIGQLRQRIPSVIDKNFNLLSHLFSTLHLTDGDLRRTVRDTLISITPAFVLDKNDEHNISLMNGFLSTYIEKPESNGRFVAMHYVANVFPPDDVPSRYLLLLASGDEKQEIRAEATKVLYAAIQKDESDKSEDNQIPLPDFKKLVSYIYSKMQSRDALITNNDKNNAQTKVLPYNATVVTEMITYLRICLAKSANVSVTNGPLQHPCESTPLIARYLRNLYERELETLNNYLDMILNFNRASPDETSLQALLEVVGSVPQFATKLYENELSWLRNLLTSVKLDVRRVVAKIYGMVTARAAYNDFEARISEISTMVDKKHLESQHGSLLALTHMMERRLIFKRNDMDNDIFNWNLYINVVKTLCSFLSNTTTLLTDAAVQSVGVLGKTCSLPLPDDGTTEELNKRAIVDALFSKVDDAKSSTEMKEKAALSLGHLCVGENFPHTSYIVNKILGNVKETKDIEIHMIMGEVLVCCVQGEASPEKRDAWTTLPSEHAIPFSDASTELLARTLDELLRMYKDPHPNSRQAVCVWLLALLKHNVQRECVKQKFSLLHHAFMEFLSSDSDIVQDIAAKGLGLIHFNSSQEEKELLVSSILDQFLQGRKSVQKVTADTKLFEDGQLGKSPTNGNLSTYKEICSLATELQKPDLVYYFMHLANHNAVWNSKKGAAFGFAAIARIANDELNKYLPSIIPRLYRYQFDPTPKIQHNMASIWHAIVPSTAKAIEQYHKEILNDITDNLTNHEWRVRISCCNALADLLRSNARFDLANSAPELLKKLFRVMDDIHEGTRTAATNTTKVLTRVCVRYCDSSNGKEGEEVLRAILPVLLDIGIVNVVGSVRALSLQTVSQLVSRAGNLLKPSLVTLIPALLTTIGESENPNLSYLSNVCGTTAEARNAVDAVRASAVKEHHSTETMTKCIQYIDEEILKELMPRVVDLIRSSVNFGTKITCSHFVVLLSIHYKRELQPYCSKVLSALTSGLSDRNSVVRKNNATAIGHVVGSAKTSSLDKLFKTLSTWYTERDDSTKLTIAHTLQAINNYNQEILKNYSNVVIPLVFFAMHEQKTRENENAIELWTELWNEITPGTEAGLKQNIESITNILHASLQSSSWTAKAQAANAIHTLAQKLGNDIDATVRNALIKVLTDGLRGRTWEGKDRLLNALATLACSESLKKNPELSTEIVQILHRESKKESLEYRRYALEAFGPVLYELDVDKFKEVYEIAQEIWSTLSKKNEDEPLAAEERTKRNDVVVKLQETVHRTLGRAWPSSKETQDKYCLEFINHYSAIFPVQSTIIQIAMLSTVNIYVDKLVLLKLDNAKLSVKDREKLNTICETLNKILKFSIGVPSTRIRKEALNLALSLGKKLQATDRTEQFNKMISIVQETLPDLTKDNEPEIRTRIIDIKEMLKI